MNTPVTPPSSTPPTTPPSAQATQTRTEVQPAASSTSSPLPETVEIRNLPVALGAPVVGRSLEGVVVEAAGADRYTLRTSDGDVALRTTSPLQPGAAINLKLLTETAPILAAIIAAPPSATALAPTLNAAPPSDAAPNSDASVQGDKSPTILATVTASAASTATNAIPGATTAKPGATTVFLKGASPSIAALRAGPPIGSRAPIRILSARPPGAAGPANASTPTQTGSFEGVVTSTARNGQVTLRSPLGELTFTPDRPMPLGASLMLQLEGDIQFSNAGAASPQSLAFAPYWTTLQSLLTIEKGSSVGQSTVSDAIPKPNTALTASAMFFMSALRMGDLRQWLGPNAMPLLEQSGLLGQMADEFASMQLLTLDSNANEWRLFLIPFLTDGLLQQLKLYIHDNKEGDDENSDPSAQHFVIEVEFKQLGPFQFEGLTRPQQFDLIIRTERNIPESMRNGIQDVFTDTITALGLTGFLTFKMAEPFLSQPRQSASPHGPEILI